ncbi:AraC family transcriptional regulator [Stappia sp. BW2]|jgi:AraC-like DNA-binding protein|uniref:AraC family transcriptional regulator n=1 Tax=Stappia sp. BW2 TaxID=2592622 RepID=UPI0011DEE856|nr:AraC family transcriptional regulator [Stappia sp. BW2]TYC65529.1 AraC family transcriptional regulator [Stappia sp. BW2]
MVTPEALPTKEYFAQHPVVRTRDMDEARHIVSRKLCDHKLEVVGRQSGLFVRHNAVTGRSVSVNYLRYGADVTVDPGQLGSFYLFQVPLSGCATIRHRGEEMTATTQVGAIVNPDRGALLHWRRDCSKLLLQVDRSQLEAVARSITGAPLPGPIRFQMQVDLTNGPGRQLRRLVMACAQAIENGDLFLGELAARDLKAEEDLAHALLTLQPSNISHIIERSDRRATPREIRISLEYIHANLGEPITLADIAHAARMNVRTLQKGFKRICGQSPMQVLRNARLDTAHYMLAARRDPPSVSEAAYSCGFSHLGRFSYYYKERFGHLPSDTH